jgi:hypothetical protein
MLQSGRAWFETRPLGAPHHEELLSMAPSLDPHPEEVRSAVSKDARLKSIFGIV